MKPSVLLVDDVEANLVALDAVLEDIDCEKVRATSGNAALRELLKREFAVMLLDVQMPGMDGYEVATLARQNSQTCNVPIVFLTAAQHTEDSLLKGYGAGAIDYLLKPYNPTVLRAKVAAFVELYEARKRLEDEIVAHKKTLNALELANEALRHFTNAASHDLKAPLRSMHGFLSILMEDHLAGLPDEARDYVERSIRASTRMDSLLDSLLSYARLRKPVESSKVDCNVVLSQVRTDLSERIKASSGTLEASELPTVRGDQGRIYQLLLNLVGNALKFQRVGQAPHVRVSAERNGAEWLLCVADNGIGIKDEHSRTVFGAFQRLNAQSTYEGSGLGLAICQQIVEQHGGRIWVESKPNEGSRFYIALPVDGSSS